MNTPDNAIQEFWRWSNGNMSITYPEKENMPASYWGVKQEIVKEYAAFLEEELGLVLQESNGTYYGYIHPTIEADPIAKSKLSKNTLLFGRMVVRRTPYCI